MLPSRVKKRETFTDQKSLSISSLKTDYLNIDSSSGSVRDNETENFAQKNAFFVEVLTILHIKN